MELGEILALVNAGYTKDEINTMLSGEHVQPAAAPVQVQPQAQPHEQQQEQVQPAEEPEPSLADVMKGIAKLTSAIQANAIAQSQIPGGSLPDPKQAASAAVAEIIRPTYKERTK